MGWELLLRPSLENTICPEAVEVVHMADGGNGDSGVAAAGMERSKYN